MLGGPTHLVRSPAAREEVPVVIAVQRDVQDAWVTVEGLLGPISVVHVLRGQERRLSPPPGWQMAWEASPPRRGQEEAVRSPAWGLLTPTRDLLTPTRDLAQEAAWFLSEPCSLQNTWEGHYKRGGGNEGGPKLESCGGHADSRPACTQMLSMRPYAREASLRAPCILPAPHVLQTRAWWTEASRGQALTGHTALNCISSYSLRRSYREGWRGGRGGGAGTGVVWLRGLGHQRARDLCDQCPHLGPCPVSWGLSFLFQTEKDFALQTIFIRDVPAFSLSHKLLNSS